MSGVQRPLMQGPPHPRIWPGSIVGNPLALVGWAVATGRLNAADGAVWLAYLTGPAAVAYADELVADTPSNYLRIGGGT